MKNKKACLPVKQGSILAYSLIIIATMLAIAGSLSVSSILEKKSASGTEFSMQSLQTADSGVQLALKKINAELKTPTGSPVGTLKTVGELFACNASNVIPNNTDGGTNTSYELSFLKTDGTTQVKCNEAVSLIAEIKSVGTYKNTVRAVSVTVAASDCARLTCGSMETCIFDGITYGTVEGADGKCWLDRNLGAKRPAEYYNDQDSYGWLFQWGRKADGHQFTAWGGQPSPALSDAVLGTSATSTVATPNDVKFLMPPASPFSWLNPLDDTLWAGVNADNNPCPEGFRLPTIGEWEALRLTSGITNITNAISSTLHLPTAGQRIGVGVSRGTLDRQGIIGWYWSSTPGTTTPTYARYFSFDGGTFDTVNTNGRSNGYSVRCVKD
jgi:uncharacterized protein (TIGR02145 family)